MWGCQNPALRSRWTGRSNTEHIAWRAQFFGKKKPKWLNLGSFLRAWQFPTFTWQTATLSSALSGFTSEFGMGSGGSRSLWSPSKLVWTRQISWLLEKVFSSFASLCCFALLLYSLPRLFFASFDFRRILSVTPGLEICNDSCLDLDFSLFDYGLFCASFAIKSRSSTPSNWLGVIWSSLTGN